VHGKVGTDEGIDVVNEEVVDKVEIVDVVTDGAADARVQFFTSCI